MFDISNVTYVFYAIIPFKQTIIFITTIFSSYLKKESRDKHKLSVQKWKKCVALREQSKTIILQIISDVCHSFNYMFSKWK